MGKVAGILLAAGRSTRMEGKAKMLLALDGEPIGYRSARTLSSGGVDPLVVVIPPQSPALRKTFQDLNVLLVENKRRDEGMSTSIATGVVGLGDQTGYVAVALGDMPLIAVDTVKLLCQKIAQSPKGIALPLYEGRRGHPVIFDLAKYRQKLLSLKGDHGAKSILKMNSGDILEVEVDDPGVVVDIDTPEAAVKFLQGDQWR